MLRNHYLLPSCSLFSGVGTLFPVLLQIILVLSTDLNSSESQLSDHKTLCLYVLFGAVFLGISLGLFSLIRLSKSGIYELFAGRDCVAHSPKNITLGSVPETAKRRYHAIKWYLLAEFTLSLVSYFVLSLAPFIHDATYNGSRTSTSPFWTVYLATVFVAIFRFGDSIGRLFSRFCCDKLQLDINVATFCYLTASIFRLGFAFAAVFYIRTPFLVYYNFFMIGSYLMLAFTNGFFSVAITSSCQSLIMVQRKDSCPIVSQFLWISGILGANVGIALSFTQVIIWHPPFLFGDKRKTGDFHSLKSCFQLQNYWHTVPYLGLNGLSMILCTWFLFPAPF